MSSDLLVFEAGDAKAVVDVERGGRLAGLSIDGTNLLWSGPDENGDADPLAWGSYPMVPFAGRIRHGRFRFDGTDHVLPPTLGDHAMHGYGYLSPWSRVDESTIAWEFADPWPFAGRATQRFTLEPGSLTIEMQIDAHERQPILVGWHPWFVRENHAGSLILSFPAQSMYVRDTDGMPADVVPTQPGPWDDCFTDLTGSPKLRWGDLSLTLSASADHWVVFDEPDHALCVEPQTGPPNEINTEPNIVDAGEQMVTSFTLSWTVERSNLTG